MDDRLSRLEAAVQTLERRIALIEAALAAAHASNSLQALPGVSTLDETAATPTAQPARERLVAVLSLTGRSFVVLGGAYLLRALTDSAILPEGAGIGLGLAYAIVWLAIADRSAGAGRKLSAIFHIGMTATIAFPLLWEATFRFGFLGPRAAAWALAVVTFLGFGVAVHRRIQIAAWIVEVAALATTLALVAATGTVAPFAVYLIALGVASLWLGYECDWILLRWPAAAIADLVVVGLTIRAASRSWSESALMVVAVQLALLNGYVASIAVRTIVRARPVIPFEVVQTVAAVGVGFGGAVFVARATGTGALALALVNLAVGFSCYGVALAFIGRLDIRRNFQFYTSLGLVLVLVSSRLLLADDALALWWSALAIVLAAASRYLDQASLELQAAIVLAGAAIVSDGLTAAGASLLAPADGWQPFTWTMAVVVGAAAIVWASGGARASVLPRASRLALCVMIAWWCAGWLTWAAASRGSFDPGSVATIRTVVLASLALAAGGLGQIDRFRESAWLLYVVLVAGGLKLLLEDLPRSRPATLFVGLAVYGLALIVAPRLVGRR